MLRRKRTRVLIATATIMVGAVILAACGPAPGAPSSAAFDLRQKMDYHRMMNRRSLLGFDGSLEGTAQMHADRLAAGARNCSNLWHSPEMGAWYGGYAWGENVACVPGCPGDGTTVFYLWRGSPGHNANMLNPAFGVTGVGVTCNGTVQMVVAHYRSP